MKKFISFLLAAAMVAAMSTTAFALVAVAPGPASGPANNNPGANQVDASRFAVRIGGNGSSARITVYADGVPVHVSGRPANNVYNPVAFGDGYVINVFVRGNSILRATLVASPEVYVPTYETVTERIIVDTIQLDSDFVGQEEVEGSRSVVGLNVVSTHVATNFSHIPDVDANGMGVTAGFIATGSLYYEYVRNYVEVFQNVYQYVTTITWSDGREYVSSDEEFFGEEFFGEEYYTENVGHRDFVVDSGNTLRLHRGEGQGVYSRSAVSTGAFVVTLYLENQGQGGRVAVIDYSYNINAL